MKRFVSVLTISTFLVVPVSAAHAAAADNWYLGLSGDLTWLRHSDTGGGGNVALGYRSIPGDAGNFRLEGEAGYHSADGDNGFTSTHYFTYMGNVYYDFNSKPPASGWQVSPYVGAGLGDAAVHFGHSSFSNTLHHSNNTFAWQGMLGLSFLSASMPATDWVVGYRYLGTDEHNLHANNLELAARFHF